MSLIYQATCMNNEGARLFELGNISESLQAFQRAVAMMKQAATSNNDEDRATAIETPTVSKDGLQITNQCKSFIPTFRSSRNNTSLRNQAMLKNDLIYMYNRPLIVPTQSNNNNTDVSLLGAVFILNFALACHQYGMNTGLNKPCQRAMMLYELTLSLTGNIMQDEAATCSRECSVVECLIYNNMAQLSHEQYCDYYKSQVYMNQLQTILSDNIVDNNDCASVLEEYLDEIEIEELFLNLMYLNPPTVAHAA